MGESGRCWRRQFDVCNHIAVTKLLLVLGVVATSVLLIGCVVRQPKGPPLVVHAFEADDGCLVTVNDERVTSERLLEIASGWPTHHGLVRIEKETPYRCVGAVVFTLQRAGFVRVRTIVVQRQL